MQERQAFSHRSLLTRLHKKSSGKGINAKPCRHCIDENHNGLIEATMVTHVDRAAERDADVIREAREQ